MTREIREITVLWRRGPCHSLGLTDAEMVYSLLTLTMLSPNLPDWQQLQGVIPLMAAAIGFALHPPTREIKV